MRTIPTALVSVATTTPDTDYYTTTATTSAADVTAATAAAKVELFHILLFIGGAMTVFVALVIACMRYKTREEEDDATMRYVSEVTRRRRFSATKNNCPLNYPPPPTCADQCGKPSVPQIEVQEHMA